MNIYVFSGLGADERVFSEIDWKDNHITFLPWMIPHTNESIEDYAKRFSSMIVHDKPVLLGISFGGMMAIEVAKHVSAEKIILISSAKSREEIPWYFKLIGKLKLNRIAPASLLKSANFLTFWFFGTKTLQEKETLRTILKETDPIYLKWAINCVLNWKNTSYPSKVFHIHGSSDRILPIRYIRQNSVIKDGRHIMIVSRAKEVNDFIDSSLQSGMV